MYHAPRVYERGQVSRQSKADRPFLLCKLEALADVVSTLSNFFLFAAFCCESKAKEPVVVRLLKDYFDCMHTSVGKRWVQLHVEEHSNLLLRLILDCNAIIQPFVELAMNLDCIDCALSKRPIQVSFLAEAIS
jgi:hypothetical protein